MFRHVPNALTASRLVLAFAFFAMLAHYQYEGRGPAWLLHAAFVVYLVALFTDFLDGYLARKWKVEGAFGRVVDPFVDKILVLGSFIFFAGKNFIIPLMDGSQHPRTPQFVVYTVTGVTPWMVVVILARELLITTLRGSSEGGGQNFGAQFSGKLKMVAQSITILAILVYVNYESKWGTFDPYARGFRDLCIWATVAITVFSGLLYVQRAVALYRAGQVRM